MDIMYSIVKFFVAGGAFMYPILIVFAIATAIAIERYVTLSQVRRKNESSWQKLQPALTEGEFERAREMTANDPSTVSRLLGTGLARQGAVRRRSLEMVSVKAHNVISALAKRQVQA